MTSQPSNPQSADAFDIINARTTDLLSQGIIPWRNSWAETGQPKNLLTEKKYRGINTWMLMGTPHNRSLFLTEAQIQALGASIRPKEAGIPIIFWKSLKPNEKASIQSILVYNIDQCKGIPEDKLPGILILEDDPIKRCEEMMNMIVNPPEILVEDIGPMEYDHKHDCITIPPMTTFDSAARFYNTLFNGLVRSALGPHRLNYDMEKQNLETEDDTIMLLVAEMGATNLLSHAGVSLPQGNQPEDTLAFWIDACKKDKYLMVRAGTMAQKAVDYILGEGKVNTKEEEEKEATAKGKSQKKKPAK